MTILNERPAGMDFDAYKTHLREQGRWLKRRLRGTLIPNVKKEKK